MVVLVTIAGFVTTLTQMRAAVASAQQARDHEGMAKVQRDEAQNANARLTETLGQLRRTVYAAHLRLDYAIVYGPR